MIKLKRVYDKRSSTDGVRYLVERLWPRGIKKTDLHLDGWLKDVAPSTELRNGSVTIPRNGRSSGVSISPSSIARRKPASQSARPRGRAR